MRPRRHKGAIPSVANLQHVASDALERLTDLGLKAIQWRDTSVANHAVGGLAAVAHRHARALAALKIPYVADPASSVGAGGDGVGGPGDGPGGGSAAGAAVPMGRDLSFGHGGVYPGSSAPASQLRVRRAPEAWFTPPLEWQLLSPDFLTLAVDSVDDLGRRGTWVEWKTMRGLQLLFAEALGRMPSVCGTIAAAVRSIGEAAIRGGRPHVTELVIKFLNTFLRLSATRSGASVADAVMHEYGNLALVLLRYGDAPLTIRVVRHISHYGLLYLSRRVPFVPTAAASDLARISAAAEAGTSPFFFFFSLAI